MRARALGVVVGAFVTGAMTSACGDKCSSSWSCYRAVDGAIDTIHVDAAIDAMIDARWTTISGTVRDISGDLIPGATVTVYKTNDATVVDSTVAAGGVYSLTMPTDGGGRIAGYVGATMPGYDDSYVFFSLQG